MEHFELHKEQLEDLIIELEKEGPKVFMDLPPKIKDRRPLTKDEFGLIDDLSGLNEFLDNYMASQDIPQTVKERIRSKMMRYEGEKPREVALNEMRETIFGKGR